jgi:hypothetical protein
VLNSVSSVADRGQKLIDAWSQRVDAGLRLRCLRRHAPQSPSLVAHSSSLPPFCLHRSRELRHHRRRELRRARARAPFVPFPNRLGQNLRHDLPYTLHPSAEPAELRVERKRSLLLHRLAQSAAELLHRRGYATVAFLLPRCRVHRVSGVT